MQPLVSYLKSNFAISSPVLEALHQSFVKVELTKNSFLIKEGQTCKQLYFLEKGCLRGYYNIDGKDITQWFGFENDFVTSFRSFIATVPSAEYIHVIEDAILWSIEKTQLDSLLHNHPEIEKIVRLIYEQYYIRLEERYANAHFKTATERYESLLQNETHIIQRIPLGYIASYLGISQETLSRIRAK
jgi:CRP-like cAMP-binding protein